MDASSSFRAKKKKRKAIITVLTLNKNHRAQQKLYEQYHKNRTSESLGCSIKLGPTNNTGSFNSKQTQQKNWNFTEFQNARVSD